MDNDPHLPVCADLANLLKHGELRASRSGRFPRMHRVTYKFPSQALSQIAFGAFEVEMEVADPNLVELAVPVEDGNGVYMGDALEYLRGGITKWEAVFSQLQASRHVK